MIFSSLLILILSSGNFNYHHTTKIMKNLSFTLLLAGLLCLLSCSEDEHLFAEKVTKHSGKRLVDVGRVIISTSNGSNATFSIFPNVCDVATETLNSNDSYNVCIGSGIIVIPCDGGLNRNTGYYIFAGTSALGKYVYVNGNSNYDGIVNIEYNPSTGNFSLAGSGDSDLTISFGTYNQPC